MTCDTVGVGGSVPQTPARASVTGMDLPSLVDSLASTPGPVLTWYGRDRTELGGAVAARWLAKTANLLAGDLSGDLFDGWGETGTATAAGAGPDTAGADPAPTGTIRVDLGRSWQSVAWLSASWLSGWRSVGAAAGSLGEEGGADVAVVAEVTPAELGAVAEGRWVLAQATGPLALSWPGTLPEGVLDALAELSAQPDALEVVPAVSPEVVVTDTVAGTDGPLRLGDLGRRAAVWAGAPSRVLLRPETPEADALAVLSLWASGRSVVMVDAQTHGAVDLARIARTEKAHPLEP